MAIDVGTEATERAKNGSGSTTLITAVNPVNANGTITQIEAWWTNDSSVCYLGLAYNTSGNNLIFRSHVHIGGVASGAKQTYSGLSLDTQTGDFIGCYLLNAGVKWSDEASGDYWYASGINYVDEDSHAYTLDSITGLYVSLYGTGTETAVGGEKVISMGFIGDNPKISNVKVLKNTGWEHHAVKINKATGWI